MLASKTAFRLKVLGVVNLLLVVSLLFELLNVKHVHILEASTVGGLSVDLGWLKLLLNLWQLLWWQRSVYISLYFLFELGQA